MLQFLQWLKKEITNRILFMPQVGNKVAAKKKGVKVQYKKKY